MEKNEPLHVEGVARKKKKTNVGKEREREIEYIRRVPSIDATITVD